MLRRHSHDLGHVPLLVVLPFLVVNDDATQPSISLIDDFTTFSISVG